MKTNIGTIETTDEEREHIAATLDLPHKLAKREDIKEAINEYVKNVLIGSDEDPPRTGGHRRDNDADGPTGDQGLPDDDHPIADFKPSRGDEPYLLKARDPALRDILTRMLDVSEEYDQYVWRKHNENRQSGTGYRGD
jgi:hypothetical protein